MADVLRGIVTICLHKEQTPENTHGAYFPSNASADIALLVGTANL